MSSTGRTSRTIGLLAATAAAAAIASGCGSAASTVDPVAQAAEATTRAGGAHVAMSGTIGAAGLSQPLTLTGSGSFNVHAGEGTFAITMAGLPASTQAQLHASSLQMLELFKAGSIYLSSPIFTGKLPSGARWLRIDIAQVAQAMGLDVSSLTGGTDPTQYLKDLRGAGSSVAVAGQEPVRGVPCTHYTGALDLRKAAEAQLGPVRARARGAVQQLIERTGQARIPVEVWIDGSGLVRRIRLNLSGKPTAHAISTSIQTEYFDFGSVPAVTAPPPAEVFDVTGQALRGLGAGP